MSEIRHTHDIYFSKQFTDFLKPEIFFFFLTSEQSAGKIRFLS